MKKFIPDASLKIIDDIDALFAEVAHNDERGSQLENALVTFGMSDDPGVYRSYLSTQEVLAALQVESLRSLGELVLSADRNGMSAQIESSPVVSQALHAPIYTAQKLGKLAAETEKLVEAVLPDATEGELFIIDGAVGVSRIRLEQDFDQQQSEADDIHAEAERLQAILQRPLPESTIAGETSDIIKPLIRTVKIDPSAKPELQKSRRGEVQKKFVALMGEQVGKNMNSAEIAKLLHVTAYKIDPKVATGRTNTMLGQIFNGSLPSYTRMLAAKGLLIQRLAHRTYRYDESSPEGLDLRRVTYEYRVCDLKPQTITHRKPVERMSEMQIVKDISVGLLVHEWESPRKKRLKETT